MPFLIAAADVTYYRDVLPIFEGKCQNCHRTGEVAPMPLTTYENARPWAKAIKTAVLTRKMPPWSADDRYGHFANDPSLTAEELRTLSAWVDSGAPAGEPIKPGSENNQSSMYHKGTAPIGAIFMPRALLFLIALSLFGQSTGPSSADAYSTTDDGGQLYSISNFVLRGSTGETSNPKMFKYDGTNFSLVVQIPRVMVGPGNFYALLSPRISGDGSVVGYVATQGCGNSCSFGSPGMGYQTTLQFPGGGAPLTLPYYCQISRNAKYALCVTAEPALQQVAIVNLITMQMSAPQLTACHGRNLITSDGRALAWDQHQIVLFSATSVQPIATDSYGCPVISDDGSLIVYSSHQGTIAYNVATGTSSAITPPCTVCNVPSLSAITNDGKLVQAGGTLIRIDGGGSTTLNGGNVDILSGNGLVAYSGLSKIDVASGAVTQLALATPQMFPQGITVPGSYYLFKAEYIGTTTASATTFPGPTSLGGVQILVNGTAVPLLSVSPTAIGFQIPWETQPSASFQLVADTGSQFVQGPLQLQMASFWSYNDAGYPMNEDFTAFITPSNPAKPGDIVNFYLSGLGPVTPPVPDGIPSPASPLALLATGITVTYGATPLKVYYAGLAPGLIGIYQLTVQTPSQVAQVPNGTGPVEVQLGLQTNPPQYAIPFLLSVSMTLNQ